LRPPKPPPRAPFLFLETPRHRRQSAGRCLHSEAQHFLAAEGGVGAGDQAALPVWQLRALSSGRGRLKSGVLGGVLACVEPVGDKRGGILAPLPAGADTSAACLFYSLVAGKDEKRTHKTGRPLLGRLRHFFGDTEDRGRRASHFVLFFTPSQSHALSREARRSGSRTSRSSPAADLRPKRGLRKEKRSARAVCMGAATSLRMTRTTCFGLC
jgi:hypothetical protein